MKLSASGSARPRPAAPSTIAAASGCSEDFSTPPASRSISFSSTPGLITTSVSTGLPCVIVPVLSRITLWSFCAVCSAVPSRIRMPFSAPSPTPVVSDIGVAMPSAQGHAMMSVVTATISANTMRGSGPYVYQAMKPRMARIATVGVK